MDVHTALSARHIEDDGNVERVDSGSSGSESESDEMSTMAQLGRKRGKRISRKYSELKQVDLYG